MTDFMSRLSNFFSVDMEKKSPLLNKISGSIPKEQIIKIKMPETPSLSLKISNSQRKFLNNKTQKARNVSNYLKKKSLNTTQQLKEKVNQLKQKASNAGTKLKYRIDTAKEKATNKRDNLIVQGLLMAGKVQYSLESKKKKQNNNNKTKRKKRKKKKNKRKRKNKNL